MIENIEKLIEKARKAADIIRNAHGLIRVISHYDADGITSGAIMARALVREGKSFQLSLIKQLSMEFIQELAKELARTRPSLLVFLDLGSGALDDIQKSLMHYSRVIVADHHQVQGDVISKELLHVNPVNFGITENISASGVSYLIARALNHENKELSELSIIGAIGDSQLGSIGPDWGLAGPNKEILLDAVNTGRIKVIKGLRLWGRYTRPVHKALEYSIDPWIPGISGSESAAVQFLQEIKIRPQKDDGSWRTLSDLSDEEQQKLATGIIRERIRSNTENPDWIFGDVYELLQKPGYRDASEFATVLNATGKMKKEHLGIALCLNDSKAVSDVKDVLSEYRREIGKAVGWIRENMGIVKNTGKACYIMAGSKISEHVISNVTSILHKSDMLPGSGDVPVFAFVNTDDGKVKVSARASDELVKKGLNLQEVVSGVVGVIGGEGGGHAGAAGATIPPDAVQGFIAEADSRLTTDINLNQNIDRGKNSGAEYGRKEESEGRGGEKAKREKGSKTRESGEETGKENREKTGEKGEGGKNLERKGLVRYFSA